MRQCLGRPSNGLAHARWPCDTFEARRSRGPPTDGRCLGTGESPGGFIRLPFSCDSAFGREARTELAMPSPEVRSDRNRSVATRDRQSLRAAAQRVYRPDATKARTRFGNDLVTVVVRDLLTKESAASSATAGPTSCSTSAGPTRPDGRRSHRRNRRDDRTPVSPSSAPTTSTPTSRSRASCSPQDNGHYRDNALASLGRCGSRPLLG